MTNDHALIRELFGRPETDYREEDAARLTGRSVAALQRAVRNGELEPHNAFRRYAWSHVASFAIETRWTRRMVDKALRPDWIHMLPPLTRMTTIVVKVPLYQARFLKWQSNATLDDALAAAIDDKISAVDMAEAERNPRPARRDRLAIELRRAVIATTVMPHRTGRVPPRQTVQHEDEALQRAELCVRLLDRVCTAVEESPDPNVRAIHFDLYALCFDVLQEELAPYAADLAYALFSKDENIYVHY